MLLWLGLLSISMSLSYFFTGAFLDGVNSLDSSKLVAEPDNDKNINWERLLIYNDYAYNEKN